jgi:hypothetical protein
VNSRLHILSFAALCGAGIFALGASDAASATRAPRELVELRCDAMENHNGRLVTIEAPGLHVLRQTAATGRFAPTLPEGISSIMCGRSSIIPAANDDEVLWLGLPLYIAEMGSARRLAVLEIDQGTYRFRFLEGRARPEEQAMLDQRLAEFQARFQALQRPQR